MLHQVLAALITIIFPSNGDSLDTVKSDAQLIRDLKDVYRAFSVNHLIEDQKGNINLSLQTSEGQDLKTLLRYNIEECEGVDIAPIYDPELKSQLTAFIASTVDNYSALLKNGITSDTFKANMEEYRLKKSSYNDFLQKRFALERYVNLPEKEYWSTIDKKNFRHAPEYAKYEAEQKVDFKKAMVILEKLVGRTTDFQERTIYEIELADNYVKHDQELGGGTDSAYDTAIAKYLSIIHHDTYCLYIFESWLKWRCILQRTKGFSHSSEIPNNLYNQEREHAAKIVLQYIEQHQKDRLAINQFFLLATHWNIDRYGDYKYGNQNSTEFYEMFGTDEQKNKKDK